MEKISDKEYFSREALSNSGIKRLLKNPASFILPQEETDAMVLGRAFHCMILEPQEFSNRYAVAPQCDRRTKDGKVIWQEFIEENDGKCVLSASDFADMQIWSEKLLSHNMYGSTVEKIVSKCQVEVAHFWDQTFEFGVVPCKAKYDTISEHHGLIIDIKSAQDASPEAFTKAVYGDLAYYIQSTFYRLPDQLRGYSFCFIVVEKKAPYGTAVYIVDDASRQEGMMQIERAAEIYYNCQKSGIWPSQYNTEPQVLKAPAWFGRS